VIGRVSPSTGRRYPVTMICSVLRVPRSSVYAARARDEPVRERSPGKRGPKTEVSDDALLTCIREAITASPFVGEGHRKIRVRMAHKGTRAGKNRVLRLMREAGLLAPTRSGHPHGDPAHEGTITTERPDELWGTDATTFNAGKDGWCWFFGAIDHCTSELVGWNATRRGDRWAALEPIRQGVKYAFGGFAKDVARGLSVRSDWGPQYTSHAFGAELAWLGIQHSPSFVGEPQCNGVIERFMRTLKEQCLWLHRFEDLEHAKREIAAFIERYNAEWLVERHGHRAPRQIRADMLAQAA
jgi:putative transposase